MTWKESIDWRKKLFTSDAKANLLFSPPDMPFSLSPTPIIVSWAFVKLHYKRDKMYFNKGINLRELYLKYDFFDSLIFLLFSISSAHFQMCYECEMFFDSHWTYEQVKLLDMSGIMRDFLPTNFISIDSYISIRFYVLSISKIENIEQRGFTCSTKKMK